MDVTDRHVIVRAAALGDLREAIDRALPTILDDRIRDHLRGAAVAVVADAIFEPA